jgi:predicted nuclease of predicted toxin-antitoxin system
MGPSRLLFIDESLSKKLAAVLKQRGRAAVASSELELLELKDEPLLREVYKDREDIVFVTADDDLPREHAVS